MNTNPAIGHIVCGLIMSMGGKKMVKSKTR